MLRFILDIMLFDLLLGAPYKVFLQVFNAFQQLTNSNLSFIGLICVWLVNHRT